MKLVTELLSNIFIASSIGTFAIASISFLKPVSISNNVAPTSIVDSVRPLTTNIALEMGYAYGTHQEMLFATGVVLFVFILILNLVLRKLTNKGEA